ncbi:hypothetical protein [Treponema putidum]
MFCLQAKLEVQFCIGRIDTNSKMEIGHGCPISIGIEQNFINV